MNGFGELLKRIAEREEDPSWQSQQKAAEEKRRREAERAMARAQDRAIEALGIPPRLRRVLSGDVQGTPAIESVSAPAIETVLSGGVGVGKTVAACWWLWRWLRDPKNWAIGEHSEPRLIGSALFVSAARLSRWPRYDERKMDTLLGASRLVIDDLGTEFMDEKGAYLALLDELVDARHSCERPTVFTTNLTAEQFRARYGERIADRLRESGRFFGLGDESLRRPEVRGS